ncbi:MAG: hypothetical protein ACPHSE_01260 [Flavobacteriaceae bacterium]
MNDFSIYTHDEMDKATFESVKTFVDQYLEKYIDMNDMFSNINTFINYRNQDKDNVFEAENEIMSLDTLFEIAQINNPEHRDIFLEIFHQEIAKSGSSRERAVKIHDLWCQKALEIVKHKGEE